VADRKIAPDLPAAAGALRPTDAVMREAGEQRFDAVLGAVIDSVTIVSPVRDDGGGIVDFAMSTSTMPTARSLVSTASSCSAIGSVSCFPGIRGVIVSRFTAGWR
jgi:hypothetical protein